MVGYWSPILCVLTLYLAKRVSTELLFDPTIDYKPMTDDFDIANHGGFDTPPCIKALLNCWEYINPDVVCKRFNLYLVMLDTMCTDLRFQCREYSGPEQWPPFKSLQSVYDYCLNSTITTTEWSIYRTEWTTTTLATTTLKKAALPSY